jgi:uncharacterized membrane protein YedE/YeeE
MFDSPDRLLLGLLFGIVFGFLLQKGQVAKFSVIVGQFVLKDWTVVRIMGTAVVVGSAGVYALVESGHAELHVKPFLLGGVLWGGVCFGVGMAVLGYCPGTTVAACGEGKPDAMVGVLGMLAGALAFVAAWPILEPLMKLGDMGKITLPVVTGASPWLWIGGLASIGITAIVIFDRRSHSLASRTEPSKAAFASSPRNETRGSDSLGSLR